MHDPRAAMDFDLPNGITLQGDLSQLNHTASISQCFMTKHCKKIEERDTLLFTILLNKKDQYHTEFVFVFLFQDMI